MKKSIVMTDYLIRKFAGFLRLTAFALVPILLGLSATQSIAQIDRLQEIHSPDKLQPAHSDTESAFLFDGADIKVYPNPFREFFWLDVPDGIPPGSITFRMFDMSGRLEYEETILDPLSIFMRNDLVSGIYSYGIWEKSRIVATGKVIVE